MHLTVNGEGLELDAAPTVAQLVQDRAPGHRRVAVAVNGDVVPRSAWDRTALAPGDAVELLVAVAGG